MADQENQLPSMRHYRSMLVVDVPFLGPYRPMSYDELYVDMMLGIAYGSLLRHNPGSLINAT